MNFIIRKELAGTERYIVVDRHFARTFNPGAVRYDPDINYATRFEDRQDAERWVSALCGGSDGSFMIVSIPT
jgi:hypothetical protein